MISFPGHPFRTLSSAVFAFAFIVFFALVNLGLGQEEMSDATENKPKSGGNFPAIKETAPGIFQVGGVTLDKNTRTVTFPGKVNMDAGTLEYLLVQEQGKTHESAFSTKIEPYHLHLAMLLLGAKVPKPAAGNAPPGYMNMQYLKTAPKPKGDDVVIRIRWKDGEKEMTANAEDFIYNDETKAPMSKGPWIYTGSMLSNGVFLAQEERSIAALVIDPAALIINARPGSDNNLIWSVKSDKIPKAGTPVDITIQLISKNADDKAGADTSSLPSLSPSAESKPSTTP